MNDKLASDPNIPEHKKRELTRRTRWSRFFATIACLSAIGSGVAMAVAFTTQARAIHATCVQQNNLRLSLSGLLDDTVTRSARNNEAVQKSPTATPLQKSVTQANFDQLKDFAKIEKESRLATVNC